MPKIVVVTPTYNEADNLPILAGRLFSLPLDNLSLIVVDDNSPDGTAAIARSLASIHKWPITVIDRPYKAGVGTAYIKGFRLAGDADYVVQMDADLSHNPGYIVGFINFFKSNDIDVIVASRYLSGGSDMRHGFKRRLLSRVGVAYCKVVLGLPLTDVTGGFKCFRRSALDCLDLSKIRSNGFAFQVEMAYACYRKRLRVKEMPICFVDRKYGYSKISSGMIVETIWRPWQIRFRY